MEEASTQGWGVAAITVEEGSDRSAQALNKSELRAHFELKYIIFQALKSDFTVENLHRHTHGEIYEP